MSRTTPLLTQIKDPDHKVEIDDKRLVDQFTKEGLDTLVAYYNEKYPKRGRIAHVTAPVNIGMDLTETDKEKEERMIQEVASAATPALQGLRESSPLPLKFVLTFYQKRTTAGELLANEQHSNPLLLTDKKLILLRDESEPIGIKYLQEISRRLGVNLIQQIVIDPTQPKKPREQRTSIQGDHKNCNGIAVGILKDLDQSDLAKVSQFEDGYLPLAKMLKYSQSESHIIKNFPTLANEPVKKDGTTLLDYISQNKFQENGELKTKISTKMEALKSDFKSLESEGTPTKWAQKILAERQLNKQKERT